MSEGLTSGGFADPASPAFDVDQFDVVPGESQQVDAEQLDADQLQVEQIDQSLIADSAETVSDWEATGDPRVDDAVARLSDLSGAPIDEHVAVFDEVARRLHDALSGITSES